MPRDGSNNYTLPEAPFIAGTVAQPAPVNSNFSDVAAALTASLTRGETTPFTRTLLDDADAVAARTTLGAVGVEQAGFRNIIINANPLINQRGYVSGTAVGAANTYTLDRWRVVTSGQAVTWSDSAGIRTVSAPAGGMEQVIEGLGLRGGTYTLDWTGTATATVNGASVGKKKQVTLPGGTNATLRMTGGTWSQVQLEPGPIATQFEYRPPAAELTLCQRYYRTGATGVGHSSPGSFGIALFPIHVQAMRATPTVGQNATLLANINSIAIVATGPGDFYLEVTAGTLGNCSALSTWTASAEL